MEKVPNIPGSIPSLPVYPPESLRSHIKPEEWQSCLDTWLFCIEFRLRLGNDHFSNFKFSQNASGIPFLLSYLVQFEHRALPIQSGSKEAKLHHQCYFLLKRLLLTTKTPYECNAGTLFDLLGYGSVAFQAIADWRSTLKQACNRNEAQVKIAIESCKAAIIKEFPDTSNVLSLGLRHLSSLVKCLPEAAVVIVAGADYQEAVANAYASYAPEIQRAATESLYLCLKTFMTESNKHTSLLLDTLFDLKSYTERIQKQNPDSPTLFSNLVCSTPFLRHLKSDSAVVSGKRGQGLVDTLSEYRQHTSHLHPPPPRTVKKRKGKEKTNPQESMHMHKASQVSQVHDLFPDLSPGYVMRLLDHFSDDVETVIAALLEPESLPADLQDQHNIQDEDFPSIDGPPDLAPQSTPPLLPQRKNVFDGDELDRLQISSAKLHRGRKDVTDQPMSIHEQSRSKAAILSALAAFDADDDERDDTYDVADVGGAVDNTLDSDERRNQSGDKNEEALFKAWKANPELFGRDSKTRMSTARRQFNDEVNMTNEQVEGWAIMLSKDPKMVDRLQQKYSLDRSFQGTQRIIQSTKWQADASPSDSQDEGSGTQSDGRRVGQAGIRGPRVWNRGGRGGGSTAGPGDSEATQLARKRKEQGRGRGGAHNRRDGRAKKIGRGMAGPTA